jgi:hypothetical protein
VATHADEAIVTVARAASTDLPAVRPLREKRGVVRSVGGDGHHRLDRQIRDADERVGAGRHRDASDQPGAKQVAHGAVHCVL